MKIQTSVRAAVPRRLEVAKTALPSSLATTGSTVVPLRSIGVHGVHFPGGHLLKQAPPEDKSQEIIRLLCDQLAESLGGKAKIVNRVIWFSLDAKAFVDELNDDEATPGEKATAGLNVLAGAVDLLSQAPRLGRLDHAVVPLYFLAEVGDRVTTGRCEVTPGDLASHFDDPHAALLKLPELLK